MRAIESYRRKSAIDLLPNLFAVTALTLALLLPMRVEAEFFLEERDFPMLPEYCKDTLVFAAAMPGVGKGAEHWYAVMGPTFRHVHHYCYALVQTNRANFFSRNQKERRSYLYYSLEEFDYVIRNAPRSFVLLPEIHTKKGENLIRLGDVSRGTQELLRAIDLKPEYWPPYAYMSDYYKQTGQLALAREWLTKGLSVSPNTKALLQRLAEIDAPQSKRNDLQPHAAR
jgi:tetratricopeptide (TPR) repeat protein